MSENAVGYRFVAQLEMPSKITLHLSHTGVAKSSLGSFEGLGWELVVEPDEQELSVYDFWEETLLQIFMHVDSIYDGPIAWVDQWSGRLADLIKLQPSLDASQRFAKAMSVRVAPNGQSRLCFNHFDDGSYRFTLEERITYKNSFAWVPRQWSHAATSLNDAEREASRRFQWLAETAPVTDQEK